MYETVPQELKSLPNWVGWKLETRDGKPTKVPYSRTGIRAAATNPQDWRNFNDEKVRGAITEYAYSVFKGYF